MEIEVDNFCHLKFLLKPFDPNQKIDIVVTSLFKMEKGYKYFEKYVRGIELASRKFNETYPELYLMLFIDQSIIDDPVTYHRIKRLDNGKLILIQYQCSKYFESKRHPELFGTLVRFLPFFDYQGNNSHYVIGIDADIDETDANVLINNYKYFKKIKTEYHYDTNMFYEILSKWALKDDYTIIASRHMCKYKFPLKLLTDYLQCVKDKTCEYMEDIKNRLDYQKYRIFPYGVDEYFMNYIILPYIKKNLLKYSVSVRYSITAPLYFLNRQNTIEIFSTKGKYLADKLKSILRIDVDLNYKQLINKFDDVFYPYVYEHQKNVPSFAKDIAVRYYDFIKEMYKEKNYQIFSKETLKKILTRRQYLAKNSIIIYQDDKMIKKYAVKKSIIQS